MELAEILHSIELFDGLDEHEIQQVSLICKERKLHMGEMLTTQGSPGDDLYIVTEGFLEVLIGDSGQSPSRVVVNLGPGQIVGEMSLIDQGPRSATVRAIEESTVVQVIQREEFERLCQSNYHIGYVVMRNMAADLSFKLRHRNLSERG